MIFYSLSRSLTIYKTPKILYNVIFGVKREIDVDKIKIDVKV